jgi:hypothetical protein
LRRHTNTVGPHALPGYRPPVPQTINPFFTHLDRATILN